MASQVDIEKAKSIGGWMSERELTWLATTAKRCDLIVEFGSFHGRSTRALADNTEGAVWAVDPWNGDYKTEEGDVMQQVDTYCMPYFKKNLADHIAAKRVFPVRAFSYKFELPFKVDMVFIDGDHRYETVKKDIKRALSLLKPGGIISGHDYDHPTWPGVKKAVHELLGVVNLEETIWWKQLVKS